MTLKSEIGASAAWKGFSSQTLYIAYRLISLNDKYNIYPETIEFQQFLDNPFIGG